MSSKDSVLLVVTTDLVSNPEAIAKLQSNFSGRDVHQQLLERLSENAVVLPKNKYAEVYITGGLPPVTVVDSLYDTLVENGTVTGDIQPESGAHFIVAGFTKNGDGQWTKKSTGAAAAAPVQLRRPASQDQRPQNPFKRAASGETPLTLPNEAETEEDGIIDEDDLVSDSNVAPAYNYPARCDPGPGKKRRRACKDCTCGLKEAEEAEDEEVRGKQSAVMLNADDIAEIDFTVPGKAVGGCGSCALGDAFRCDGCPYLGLPPFKPGEVVSVDQFGDDF